MAPPISEAELKARAAAMQKRTMTLPPARLPGVAVKGADGKAGALLNPRALPAGLVPNANAQMPPGLMAAPPASATITPPPAAASQTTTPEATPAGNIAEPTTAPPSKNDGASPPAPQAAPAAPALPKPASPPNRAPLKPGD